MSSEKEDKIDIKGLGNGSEQVYAEVYQLYEPKLHRFCRNKIDSRPNAEDEARDIVQDVLLKLWRDRESICKSIGDDGSLKAYLYKMVDNRVTDLYRIKDREVRDNRPEERSSSSRYSSDDTGDDDGGDGGDGNDDGDDDELGYVDAGEDQQMYDRYIIAIDECIATELPKRQQQLINMRIKENLSNIQIATQLKISYNTVASEIHKAKSIMKQVLNREVYDLFLDLLKKVPQKESDAE